MSAPVICGVDRGPEPFEAVAVAAALAAAMDLRLVLVHVVPRAGDPVRDQLAERLLGELARALPHGADAELRVEHGHPADALVASARRLGARLLVVGSHGPHAPRLGSVSAEVSRCAPCPVVVVPPGGGHDFAAAEAHCDAGRPPAADHDGLVVR